MSWIKNSVLTTFLTMATIFTTDLVGYIFKDKLAVIIPGYGLAIDDFSRGYPIGHFQNDSEIGFDITPKFKTTTSTKPREYETYEVWGNGYGCFDDEWSEDEIIGGIYLAGDSFTWGYTKYDKKFGTLLEKTTGKKVYACGVTHTGQGHQFQKFKRLYENGLKPSVVVVNVTPNDPDNDYFFPHTAIIDGFMVESVERCGDFETGDFSYRKLSYENLVSEISERQNHPTWKSLLRQYSLTANVIANVTHSMRHKINKRSNRPIEQSSCVRSVYADLSAIGSAYPNSKYSAYPYSEYTEKNRKFISGWIAHAKLNNYLLIFSFIPSIDVSSNNLLKFVNQFIIKNGGVAHSFDDFCGIKCRGENKVYFQFDAHFNESGNKLYAQYLKKLIESK
jgi:hypothetical protein